MKAEYQAEVHIESIYSYIGYPEGLTEEDWVDWRPRIVKASSLVSNENVRKRGLAAIYFFSRRFDKREIAKKYSTYQAQANLQFEVPTNESPCTQN